MKKTSETSTVILPAPIPPNELLTRLSNEMARAIVETARQMDEHRPIIMTAKKAIVAYKAIGSVRQAALEGTCSWRKVANLKSHLETCQAMALTAATLDEAVQCLQMAREIHKIVQALEVPNQVKDTMILAFKRSGVA